jgi:hypothetical protein
VQNERTERPLILATDPAGRKMQPAQVVQVHKLHRRGVGWQAIADQVGVDKKNIGRIVTGLRWRSLHPTQRPDLYRDDAEAERPAAAKPVLVVEADDPLAGTMQRIYAALKEAA